MNNSTKKILTVAAVLVGGYYLLKTMKPSSFSGLYGIGVHPSMVPVGNVYPGGGSYKRVTVF